jgi:hypothetical protein
MGIHLARLRATSREAVISGIADWMPGLRLDPDARELWIPRGSLRMHTAEPAIFED